MQKFKGQVFRVYEKAFSGKPSYSFKLEDVPIYFRTGPQRHEGKLEPGNVVEFSAEVSDDGKTGKVVSEIRVVPAASKTGSATAATSSSFAPAVREASIHYQSARKDALAFLDLLVKTGAVKVPAKTGVETLEALLDKYTAVFYEDIAALGAVKRATEGDEAKTSSKSESDDEIPLIEDDE